MLLWMLLLSLLNFSHLRSGECISSNVNQPLVPAMYVFGDSLNDVGNNLLAIFPPYGANFSGGVTGRFSNGKLFPDFIAEYVGLPYPTPYRFRWIAPSETGYNYAYASCGILPESGSTGGCWTLGKQLEYFQETVEGELQSKFESPENLSQHLADSLFVIWAGSNDYILSYFKDKIPEYNPEQFAQLLIDTLSEKIQMLYDLGARKALVMEMGPLGCTPESRGDHEDTWCDESQNQNVTLFNNKLSLMMETLASTLPDAHFSLGKIYDVSNDAFNNPEKYGLTNVGKSCCYLAGETVCMPCIFGYCFPLAGDPDEFLFWDGVHPSQASISIMASQCINGSSVCVPMNVEELVQVKAKPAILSLTSI